MVRGHKGYDRVHDRVHDSVYDRVYDRVIWEVALFSVQLSEKIALKSVQFKGWENIIISGIYLFLMDSANYNYGWGNNL